jgi:integrase/recombinase XerC
LRELDGYIRGERADAVRAAPRGRRPATSLFVNSKQSHAHVGKNITKDTLQHSFHMAVVAAGLVEHVTKTDPDTEKQYVKVNEAMYSFHDLRHTFALANYWTEARRGNREPWKIVQALLGHKSLSTTLRYYLAITPSFEYGISDIMYKWRRNLVFDTDLQ